MSNKVSLPDGYHIVWSEEFNGNALNESVWSAETRAPGWITGERQEYCGGECLKIDDGFLHIRPRITTNNSGGCAICPAVSLPLARKTLLTAR